MLQTTLLVTIYEHFTVCTGIFSISLQSRQLFDVQLVAINPKGTNSFEFHWKDKDLSNLIASCPSLLNILLASWACKTFQETCDPRILRSWPQDPGSLGAQGPGIPRSLDPGIMGSQDIPGPWDPRILGHRILGSEETRILGFPGPRIPGSRSRDIRIPGFQDPDPGSHAQDPRILGFEDPGINGSQDSGIPGSEDPGVEGSWPNSLC